MEDDVKVDVSTKEKPNDDDTENIKYPEYPAACLVLTSCIQDYERIQESYNKIYEKISIALAFTGVILTIMLGTLDFSMADYDVSSLKVGELILCSIEIFCLVGSVLLMIVTTIYLLILLRGRSLMVFKSEDVRKDEIYREAEPYAAMWLIDKYTRIVFETRPIVQKKQAAFDRTLGWIIVGIILYAFAIILRKVGF